MNILVCAEPGKLAYKVGAKSPGKKGQAIIRIRRSCGANLLVFRVRIPVSRIYAYGNMNWQANRLNWMRHP